ncbi:MAG: hypothetical protein AAGK32_01620, partial [Actinomycetota bacterium]
MLVVTEYRHRLEPHYLMTLPPTDVVEVLTDKVAFYRYAQRHGHPIPATRFVGPDQPASEQVAGLRFPLAVKPPQSKDPRWLARTNVKAFRVTNPAELEQVVDEFLPVAGTLIVQEWIEGPETSLFACHGYFDQQGEPLVSFTSRKIRQWPVDTGQGSLAEEVRCEPARQITFDLFRGIGFSGLGYVEVKEDERTGAFLIVEPNIGRVSGRMAVAEAGGVELLLTMYCHATGGRPLARAAGTAVSGSEVDLPPPGSPGRLHPVASWPTHRASVVAVGAGTEALRLVVVARPAPLPDRPHAGASAPRRSQGGPATGRSAGSDLLIDQGSGVLGELDVLGQSQPRWSDCQRRSAMAHTHRSNKEVPAPLELR